MMLASTVNGIIYRISNNSEKYFICYDWAQHMVIYQKYAS